MKKGSKHTEESKKKMSQAQKGKRLSEETRRKIGNAHRGKKVSEETRRKMSKAKEGKQFSEEHRKKLRESHLGKRLSEAAKKKIGKASKGRKLSEETKRRMRESQRKRHGDPVKRFWSKVDKTDPNSCWIWTAYIGPRGYGRVGWKGSPTARAHRVAYEITFGPIPKGMIIMHTCDNKKCVNPAHLSLGTQLDNMRDAAIKEPVGSYNKQSKLTKEEVKEIRTLAKSGIAQKEIAKRYSMSQSTISDIVNQKIWKHVKQQT